MSENISPEQAARQLLACCLNGTPWRGALLDRLIEPAATPALFSIVIEGLADLFEPRLCAVYAELFSEVIARTTSLHAPHLEQRYERTRMPRRFDGDPASVENVFVLSRVTLGADVAVTSVLLDAAKQRFRDANIYFVGPQKSWELFAADTRLKHAPVSYERGSTLQDRFAAWPAVRELVARPNSVIVDPDSRITQLGLLPICAENDYFFFESRAYGADTTDPLPVLTARWAAETFGIRGPQAYIAPREIGPQRDIAVSLGVGENSSKRVDDPFERELLATLGALGRSVLVDSGAGGDERERVRAAVSGAGPNVDMFEGSFAAFAAHIANSRLYVGYDSAGGHVAAACGVPVISVFAGHACERALHRWRPAGTAHTQVIRASTAAETLAEVRRALDGFTAFL